MDLFQRNIRQWVNYDNQIKIMNNQIKELRDARNECEKCVIKYVENNNMENAVVKITDGQLKFTNVNVQQNLTYKYLEDCLRDLFCDEEVKRVVHHIKNKRERSNHLDIKRFSSK